MLVSFRLTVEGDWHKPGKTPKPLPYPEVSAFLNKYPMAKIIVVVDTHCIQEMATFLWKVFNENDFGTCTLFGVSRVTLIRCHWTPLTNIPSS